MSLKTSLGNPFLYRKGKEGYYTYNVELSKMDSRRGSMRGRGETGLVARHSFLTVLTSSVKTPFRVEAALIS